MSNRGDYVCQNKIESMLHVFYYGPKAYGWWTSCEIGTNLISYPLNSYHSLLIEIGLWSNEATLSEDGKGRLVCIKDQ